MLLCRIIHQIYKVDEEFYEKKENIECKKEIDELKELHLNAQPVEYQEKRKKINKKFSKNIEPYKNEHQECNIKNIFFYYYP